jgi:hypothetical protein
MRYQMKEKPSQLRQRIHKLEESLALSLGHILAERGPLRRGSFVTLHRKCGKPNCHCAQGERHPTEYLSTRQKGRTRLIYIGADIKEKVAEEAGRYRQFRKQRAVVARLLPELLQRIDELEETLENRDPIGVTKKQSQRGA